MVNSQNGINHGRLVLLLILRFANYNFPVENSRLRLLILKRIRNKYLPIIITIASSNMNPNNFKQIQRNYDQLSGFYDLLSGKAELSILRRAITLLKERKIEKLLDIGCGTGRALIEYRKSFQKVTLLAGIDLSFRMCRKALQQNNRITCANGHDLPFHAASFDAIVFSFSLEIFPEDCIRKALSECIRVLKPDGVVCVVCMAKALKRNVMYGLYLWAHRKFPNVVDCRPIAVIQMLNENGFTIIENESNNLWGLPVEIVLAKK